MADNSPRMENMETQKLFPIFQKNFRPKKPDPLQEIQMTLEKSQADRQKQAKKRKCLLGKKETPGLTQMILDAGQKVIGPVHCDECGLLYSPGDIGDEREHQKAHARLDNLFSIRLWKNPNIVQDFPAEACMIIEVDCKRETKRVLNSLRDFLGWIDSELGGSYDTSGTKPTERIYLYLFRTKRKNIFRVLGCAIVESIDQEKIIFGPLKPETESNCGSVEKTQIKPLLLGLTRLWTDPGFRRKQIACRVCDAIRISSIPGFVVPKYQLGILEPSEDGKAFLIRYTEGLGCFYSYR